MLKREYFKVRGDVNHGSGNQRFQNVGDKKSKVEALRFAKYIAWHENGDDKPSFWGFEGMGTNAYNKWLNFSKEKNIEDRVVSTMIVSEEPKPVAVLRVEGIRRIGNRSQKMQFYTYRDTKQNTNIDHLFAAMKFAVSADLGMSNVCWVTPDMVQTEINQMNAKNFSRAIFVPLTGNVIDPLAMFYQYIFEVDRVWLKTQSAENDYDMILKSFFTDNGISIPKDLEKFRAGFNRYVVEIGKVSELKGLLADYEKDERTRRTRFLGAVIGFFILANNR